MSWKNKLGQADEISVSSIKHLDIMLRVFKPKSDIISPTF